MNANPLRRCWAEIDIGALRHNVRILKKEAGPGVAVMAIVKADAYGHGLEKVAETLCSEVEWFGVANVREALQIKETLGKRSLPVLILSPLTPDEYETAVENGFSFSVSCPEEISIFGDVAKKLGTVAKLHAVADTGMGRMGATIPNWNRLIETIKGNSHCALEAVSTHFPNADEDPDFTKNQIEVFRKITKDLSCAIHLANSAGLLAFSSETGFANIVRPGLAIYGISPMAESGTGSLRPALSLKTRVTLVRNIEPGSTISYGSTYTAKTKMKTATLAVGYGDGYSRHLSGQDTSVLIGEKRCPVLGRVTMDQTVVDVSHLPAVEPGQEVVLIGSQGDEHISATELATRAGSIAWEIFTGIARRVDRVYLNE